MEDEQIITIALLKSRSLDTLNIIELKTLTAFFNLQPKDNYPDALL